MYLPMSGTRCALLTSRDTKAASAYGVRRVSSLGGQVEISATVRHGSDVLPPPTHAPFIGETWQHSVANNIMC